LLKANTLGKLKGLSAYKNALQLVMYPNSEEGKCTRNRNESNSILEKWN
jgi:hypothetical protein